MLKKLLRVCAIAATWAFAWGLTGAAAGAIIAAFQPDTGHIPSEKMPVLIGVPAAAFGLGAGLLYGALAVALGMELNSGPARRIILGAIVGCFAGTVLMKLFAHSYLTIFVAVLLGVLLASGFSRKPTVGPAAAP